MHRWNGHMADAIVQATCHQHLVCFLTIQPESILAAKAGVTAGFICHEKSVYTQHHAADKEDGQENTDDQRNVGFLVCPQRS